MFRTSAAEFLPALRTEMFFIFWRMFELQMLLIPNISGKLSVAQLTVVDIVTSLGMDLKVWTQAIGNMESFTTYVAPN